MVSFEVDCYSFGPLPGPITLTGLAFSKNYLGFSFDKPTCNNGEKVTMTVAVSNTVKSGTNYHFQLLASLDMNTSHLWRGMIEVQ